MPRLKEKYVVDSKGKPVSVILNIKEYRKMLSNLEELELIQAYDEAIASKDEAVPFEQAVKEIERSR